MSSTEADLAGRSPNEHSLNEAQPVLKGMAWMRCLLPVRSRSLAQRVVRQRWARGVGEPAAQ